MLLASFHYLEFVFQRDPVQVFDNAVKGQVQHLLDCGVLPMWKVENWSFCSIGNDAIVLPGCLSFTAIWVTLPVIALKFDIVCQCGHLKKYIFVSL